ncbi:DUF938 domain-containing protein [Salinicola avicenniae]|uniref:DUF938 domain-containing protein n=1 Tax=Salinicola avicenniae TaxID=2916836 RepID=UPI0020736249|nr:MULTISPECIES: DUF938 domain-containing protein [unclassified Salinicola]
MNSMDDIDGGADQRLSSPAARRNRQPILEILEAALPPTGTVLEIASGSGEHAIHFAAALSRLEWQPSDPSELARQSIAAWRKEAGLANLRAPLALDVTGRWPAIDNLAAVVCINLLHISPWSASEALFAEAGRALPRGGKLVVYGPFKRGGQHTAASNAQFDADLRARDPGWGIRDLERIEALAVANDLDREQIHALPANNLCVVWRRG